MSRHDPESLAMRFFRRMGLDGIAWSLRRLHCPVDKDALVLEVGSGGNPYARANVLLDAYEATGQRHWAPLKVDRPLVLGFAENLPFKDKAFDFVIASHVLEHSADPQRFLSELMRVSSAGYIEVPDAFMERINPYDDHRLEITATDDKLIIKKKASWIVEPDTVRLYEHKVKPLLTQRVMTKHPFHFHVRYYWKEKIAYTIVNPEIKSDWEDLTASRRTPGVAPGLKSRVRGMLVDSLRRVFSQNQRNSRIDLHGLLICPACRSDALQFSTESVTCGNCASTYSISNGIPIMSVAAARPNGKAGEPA